MSDPNYLTPKKIAKWIKSKGRGKLYNYCTICKRQFRQGTGFKSHCLTPGHIQRALEIAKNPEYYINKFSEDFKKEYLVILKRHFPNKKISAKQAYGFMTNEVHHTHLSSTKWPTLEDFIKDLGKEGLAEVELTPEGYKVLYREVDPNQENERRQAKERQKLDDEQRRMKLIEKQIKAAQEIEKRIAQQEKPNEQTSNEQSTQEETNEEPIQGFKLTFKQPSVDMNPIVVEQEVKSEEKQIEQPKEDEKKRKISEVNTSDVTQETKRQKIVNDKCWLQKGIVVKVYDKEIGNGEFYKQKGYVRKVYRDICAAKITMLDSGKKIKVNQDKLETVIPAPGRLVLILRGEHYGQFAHMKELHEKEYKASLILEETKEIVKLPYEDFSRFYE